MKSALLFAFVAVLTFDTATVSAAKMRKYEHTHCLLYEGKQIYIKFVDYTV
jgi:hypothetical protein